MMEKIIKEVGSNRNLTDREIALILKKKYPKIFLSARLDSLRRRIGVIRDENALTRGKSRVEELTNDVAKYIAKYKEDSSISVAKKLQLKYSNLKLRTIIHYVQNQRQWGV